MCMETKPLGSLIAGEIRAEAARQRMTIRFLSQLSGIEHSALCKKLKGNTNITLDETQALARSLDLSSTELMRRAEEAAGRKDALASATRVGDLKNV